MNNQCESNTIKALHHESLQAGTETAADDLTKTREDLLIEIHAAARMPPLGPDGSFVLANTIAKYASLQVILSIKADKQQRTMFFLALAMAALALVQIGVAIFNKQ
jgi:hypothetical protein